MSRVPIRNRRLRSESLESRCMLDVAPIGAELLLSTPPYSPGGLSGFGGTWARQVDAASNGTDRFYVGWVGPNGLVDEDSVLVLRGFAGTGAPFTGEVVAGPSQPSGVALAVAPNGSVIATWTADDDDSASTSHGVFVRRFDPSLTPLGAATRINVAIANFQRTPSVAVHLDGSFVVVWQGAEGTNAMGDVYARRFDEFGAALGGEFIVNTVTAGDQRHPGVAADGSGGFIVVWESPNVDGNLSGISGQRYDFGAAPIGGEFAVNTTTLGSQQYPLITAGVDGAFAVSFMTGAQVHVRRFNVDGSPRADDRVIAVNAVNSARAAISLARDDTGMVTWAESLNPGYNARVMGVSIDTLGSAVAAPFEVSMLVSIANGPHAIASLDDGFVVAWANFTDFDSNIHGRRVAAAASLPPPWVVAVFDQDSRVVLPGDTLYRNHATIDVKFSTTMSTVGGATGTASVLNPANWSLSRNGQDVSSNIAGIDTVVDPVAGSFRARLNLRRPLPRGIYSLGIRGVVEDGVGFALDGDGDAQPGGDYSFDFSVSNIVLSGPKRLVSEVLGDYVEDPVMNFDPSGNFLVAWAAGSVSQTDIIARRFSAAGIPLGAEFQVNSAALFGNHRPRVSFASDGTFVVAWTVGAFNGAYFRRFDAQGQPLGPEQEVTPTSIFPATSPTVVHFADGRFAILWAESVRIGFQAFDAGGIPLGNPIAISPSQVPTSDPAAVVDATGRLIVTWKAGTGIWLKVLDSSGTALTGNIAVDAMALGFSRPSVAVRGDGVFTVVWTRTDDRIWGRSFDTTGNPLSNAFSIAEVSPSTTPTFQFDSVGDIVLLATNRQFGIRTPAIFVYRLAINGHPTHPVLSLIPGVNLGGFFGDQSASLARDRWGNMIVCFAESDSDREWISTQRFVADSSPPPRLNDLPIVLGSSSGQHADYAVPTGSGEQLRTVPVGQIDEITIRFPGDVIVQAEDLAVFGDVHGPYSIGTFAYDSATLTARWSLSEPMSTGATTITLSDDVMNMAGTRLDGEWDNPVDLSDPLSSTDSGDATPGGAFVFRFTILPGDADRDNRVDEADFEIWLSQFDAGAGSADKRFDQGDWSGDGHVTGADYTLWADHYGLDISDLLARVMEHRSLAPVGDRSSTVVIAVTDEGNHPNRAANSRPLEQATTTELEVKAARREGRANGSAERLQSTVYARDRVLTEFLSVPEELALESRGSP